MGVNDFTSYTVRRHRAVGLGLALVSAASFGTSGSFADALMSAGWTPGAVVTTRIGLAALLLTVPALVALRGKWRLLRAGTPTTLLYGVMAVAGAQLAFFNAVRRLDVGVALLLEYLGIVLVVLWMWGRHGQRPRRLTLFGVVAALGGLALVLNLSGGGLDPVGVLWGLVAATGLATYFVVSARASADLPPLAMAWSGLVVGVLTLAVAALVGVLPVHAATRRVPLFGHQVSWLVPVVGLSLVAAAVAYTTGIAAARLLGARLASFVGLTEVLFAVVFAAVLVSQVPTWHQALGGAVVLAGVALVNADDRAVAAAVDTAGVDTVAEPIASDRLTQVGVTGE
jgi:drug/metabolite transporter (DMT)-like permease